MGIFNLFRKKHESAPVVSAEPQIAQSSNPSVYDQPFYQEDLDGFQISFTRHDSTKITFELTGIRLYAPNRSSQCGSGSDDWFFLCRAEEKDYILLFTVDASCGAYWGYAAIAPEDIPRLSTENAGAWGSAWIHGTDRNTGVHPDSIEAAKAIVNCRVARTGVISDAAFYGQR